MPKNSRPDIQVLEERIVRLEAQLLEYKDLRLYGVTKKRLSAVSDKLQDCIGIIKDIVEADTNNISASSLSALEEYPGVSTSEFNNDSDLSDIFLLKPLDETTSKESKRSSKEIVGTYSSKLQECADTVGRASGIIQINQFCQLLNSWYKARFTPDNRNPNFYFKANRIHEWIDLLIIAGGHALNQGLFSAFVSDMNSWIQDLNTPKDETWVLPYSVMQMKRFRPDDCSQEAVLFESIIKPAIYDFSFYPEELHSVKDIVISNSKFSRNDLTIDQIIKDCPRLIVTSSFDISKYQEE